MYKVQYLRNSAALVGYPNAVVPNPNSETTVVYSKAINEVRQISKPVGHNVFSEAVGITPATDSRIDLLEKIWCSSSIRQPRYQMISDLRKTQPCPDYEAPNATAEHIAAAWLAFCEFHSHLPDRITWAPDGGYALKFYGNSDHASHRLGYVEVLNTGESIALLSDGDPKHEDTVWAVPFGDSARQEALRQIWAFTGRGRR